eukprot:6180029-Pleurochrysis_carterae.AAC.2
MEICAESVVVHTTISTCILLECITPAVAAERVLMTESLYIGSLVESRSHRTRRAGLFRPLLFLPVASHPCRDAAKHTASGG